MSFKTVTWVTSFFIALSSQAVSAPSSSGEKPGQLSGPASLGKGWINERHATEVPRVSKIIGSAVSDKQNQNVGSAQDLIIDDHGRVTYVIIAGNEPVGRDKKLFAIPWKVLEVHQNGLVANIRKEQVKDVPHFESWSDFDSGDYWRKVQTYYGVEARNEDQDEWHKQLKKAMENVPQ